MPRTPGPSKPKKPHLSKGYLCLVTPAGRPKAGLIPSQIFIPYCKADLDNTGIPQNMIPSIKGFPDNIYQCRFPNCPYHALDKPSVTNQMRAVHINSMLGCFYCQDPPYGVASTKAWKAHCECLHPNVPHFWNEFEAVGQAEVIPPNVQVTRNPSQVFVSLPSAPHCSPRRAQPTGVPPSGKAEDPICNLFLYRLIVKGHFVVVLSVPGLARPPVSGLADHALKSTFSNSFDCFVSFVSVPVF